MDLLDSVKLPKYVYGDGKPRQNVWDTSSLSSFLACPRLYNLTNLNGYKMKSYGTVQGLGQQYTTVLKYLIQENLTMKAKNNP